MEFPEPQEINPHKYALVLEWIGLDAKNTISKINGTHGHARNMVWSINVFKRLIFQSFYYSR